MIQTRLFGVRVAFGAMAKVHHSSLLSTSQEHLTFGWADQKELADRIALFFSTHADSSYISHSELQSGRAIAPGQWHPDLVQIIRAEADKILQHHASDVPPKSIACAWLKNELVGIAFVSFAQQNTEKFATLDDLIVAPTVRGVGLGKQFIDWIAFSVKSFGNKRLFLESGKNNTKAHHFFEKMGFELTSVVMMRDL